MGYDDYNADYDEPPMGALEGDQQRQPSNRGKPRSKGRPDLSDYAEVKTRIIDFHTAYPEGVIWTEIVAGLSILVDDGIQRIGMKAYAMRRPGERPFVGHSWMEMPGKTPYTVGSEIENAETSAVGRALAFAGIAADKSIASLEEIEAKQAEREAKTLTKAKAKAKKDRPAPDAKKDAAVVLDGPEDTETPGQSAESKGDATEIVPEDTTASVHPAEGAAVAKAAEPKPKKKSRAKSKAEPEHDPALVDGDTGEVIGLTKEVFLAELKAAYIPMAMARAVFTDMYAPQEASSATPQQRKQTFDECIKRRDETAAS